MPVRPRLGPCTKERLKREGVPFYIGGDSDAALRRTAEHGDGYLPAGLPADYIAARLARLRELTDRTFSVTLASPFDDLENMRKYAELGIERVNLFLTPMERDHTREPLSLDETFRRLDSYIPYIEEFKN